MKRILLPLVLNCLTLFASAQNIYICKDGNYTKTSITNGLEIDLSAEDIDSITFSKPNLLPTVKIAYSGTSATVTIPEDISEYVTCTSGTSSNVVLTNTNTTDEYAYAVSGSSTAGSLTIAADYKMTVKLNGVLLTSTTGAAIDLQCGKRIDLILGDGTTNTLADATSGEQKGCLTTKGHLELSGAGTLNVTGNLNHAIRAKEYMLVKKTTGTINILKSNGDAIHVGQYFQMNGGTINIDGNTSNDGIQVEYKTDDNDVVIPLTEDADNTSSIIIKGGTFNITMDGNEDTKAFKADGDINVSGGTFVINANSNGSRGFQTDKNMTISQADGTTTMIITAAGGKCTIDSHKADPHKCMGIKVDGNLNISGGTVTVYNTGNKAKGIKIGGTYTKTGGTVTAAIDKD